MNSHAKAKEDRKIEAAQCLWEAFLSYSNSWPSNALFNKYRTQHGTAETRAQLRSLKILEACLCGDRVARHKGYTDSFDFDFCPWFLENCLEVNGAAIVLADDWGALCVQLGKEA